MFLSRLTTVGALATGLVLPAAIGVAPAHAANFTAVYNTGTGFGAQVLTADIGDTITIKNNTPLEVAFRAVGLTPTTQTVAPGATTTTPFVLTMDSGTITAAGPGVQNVLVIQ